MRVLPDVQNRIERKRMGKPQTSARIARRFMSIIILSLRAAGVSAG